MPEITDEELAALQAQAAQADATTAELAETRARLADATAAARTAIIAANPSIPADLIRGDNIAEIEQSLATAQAIANRLAEAAKAAPKQPLGFLGGGSGRQPTTVPEGVRATERIRWGLANRSAE